MKETKTLFLTGVTGGLGRELLKLFLERSEDRLLLLVRAKASDSHADRVQKILTKIGINGEAKKRIEVLAGDVSRPALGLREEEYRRVIQETDEFYHIAALTNLGASWEDAEKINLGGTLHALEVAGEAQKQGRLECFFYFSTAYVAGSLTKIHSLEDALPENPSFANAYEATKFLAEKKVREEMREGLPATIFRPSIVVGDTRTGAVSEFNVIYPFLRLFAHGFLKKLPSQVENSFNIVPIDFVVQAAFKIARQKNSLGRTFHLVTETPPTLQMFLAIKQEYGFFPPLEVVPPETFSLEDLNEQEKLIFASLNPYLGYLGSPLTFDTQNAKEALRQTDISFPKTDLPFLRKIVSYAIEKGYFLPSSSF